MWNFVAGTVCGVMLSIAYVWYDVSPPSWLELPGLFQRSLKAAVADEALVDPEVSEATRRRALEVYFANQAERAAALEAELGFPLTRAMQTRRVKRAAQRLLTRWSGLDELLKQPALREAMSQKHGEKHGAPDDDTLKRRMLMAALAEQPVLTAWLKERSRVPTETNVLEVLRDVGRLEAASSCRSAGQ